MKLFQYISLIIFTSTPLLSLLLKLILHSLWLSLLYLYLCFKHLHPNRRSVICLYFLSSNIRPAVQSFSFCSIIFKWQKKRIVKLLHKTDRVLIHFCIFDEASGEWIFNILWTNRVLFWSSRISRSLALGTLSRKLFWFLLLKMKTFFRSLLCRINKFLTH